jgi:hypothetical protein
VLKCAGGSHRRSFTIADGGVQTLLELADVVLCPDDFRVERTNAVLKSKSIAIGKRALYSHCPRIVRRQPL